MTLDMMWTALRFGLLPVLAFVLLIAVALHLVVVLTKTARLKGQFPLLFGFTLLGGILGLATGNSRLAAISVLLSTLLSVVTLLLGYLFGEERLGKIRVLMPYCIVALLLSTLYGLFLGAILRRQNELAQEAAQYEKLREQKVDWEVEKARLQAEIKGGAKGSGNEAPSGAPCGGGADD